MRSTLFMIGMLLFLTACVPLRIAPNIDDYKVTKGRKFKRSLPKRQMFVFEDSKDAGHFYNYINTKYELNHENVYDDVPFGIDGDQYFFSFYEVGIPTKTVNLVPIFVDGLLAQADLDPMLEEAYSSRKGHWYIAIEVYNDKEPDCLNGASLSRTRVLKYLRALKSEYLFTYNYNEVLFKN